LHRKGEDKKIIELFTISPRDTLRFIYEHPELASDLAVLVPDKVEEIISMIDLPKDQLVNLALKFPDKMLMIAKIEPDVIAKIFYEAMYLIERYPTKDQKVTRQKLDLIQTKISEIGQEFPDRIMPILKQMNEFANKFDEVKDIIIETAKFFPEKAVEIATFFKLEIEIAKSVPSIAAKIAIKRPELAFDIIKAVPASEKEITEHFTMKCK
jgi:hypothetical protein